jgi:hypothetical protein
MTETTETANVVEKPLTDMEIYKHLVDRMAKGIYQSLPKAGFSRETLTTLATSSKNEITWDKLPTTIKLCLVRLAMSMIPKPETKTEAPNGETKASEP